MKKNAVILTTGLSGSSVLTGLIARAGYWTGDQTYKKVDYDTHENAQLVDLHLRLLRDAGYTGDYIMEFSWHAIRQVAAAYGKVDPQPYREFLETCNAHRPWVWKDPRLWLTIRFWQPLLDLDGCRFIVLTRGLMHSWISATLRRQIQTVAYLKNYLNGITDSAIAFLHDNRLPYLQLSYEQLVVQPEPTIQRINAFLETALTIEDLRTVYTKPLYSTARSPLDYAKAVGIYLKNYRQRYR